jgi:hypothetical protein
MIDLRASLERAGFAETLVTDRPVTGFPASGGYFLHLPVFPLMDS